jgi:hypothetical protein
MFVLFGFIAMIVIPSLILGYQLENLNLPTIKIFYPLDSSPHQCVAILFNQCKGRRLEIQSGLELDQKKTEELVESVEKEDITCILIMTPEATFEQFVLSLENKFKQVFLKKC